jgi:hypothetical protein
MVTTAVICPTCQRVVALGAVLPAMCYAAIDPQERLTLPPAQLDASPKAHRDCVELEVTVPDELDPEARLAEVERIYGPQLGVLGDLASSIAPGR